MKLAIVGSRTYSDLQAVTDYVNGLTADTVLVSGGAAGVDRTAQRAAEKRGMDTKVFIPHWAKYGKSAGMRRNADIVAAADEVVAFWDGHSKGTANTIELARKAGKKVTVYTP